MGARRAWSVVALAVVLGASGARPVAAQPTPVPAPAPRSESESDNGPEQAITRRIGVWRIDALGIETELVTRLESLFRMELDRLAATPLPPRRDVEKLAGRELRDCTGEDRCLAAIGKKLGVDVMVTGSVAALGDSYILDVKAVDVAAAKQIRRIATDPLRGSPDELIEAIRVTAYRLLAPEQLHGSIIVLSDAVGAQVTVDGKAVGKTPLPRPLGKLALGPHKLEVVAPGYEPFAEDVVVRFQKSTRVVVSLVTAAVTMPLDGTPIVRERRPWYTRWYAYVGVGVGAVLVGGLVGRALGTDAIVRCDDMGNC